MNPYRISLEFWTNKSVLIIGGTGTLGQQMVKELLPYTQKIRIFSRDEFKQNMMKREYPQLDYFQGDISKRHTLEEAMHGYEIILNAAANKDLVSCETSPSNALETNVLGNQNLMHLSLILKPSIVLYCSSDKAEDPISFYGCSKFMGEYFIRRLPNYRITRAGNYWASRRSNVEIWDKQYSDGQQLTVTDLEMTRFYISIERVARFNLWCCEQTQGTYYPEMLSISNADIIKGRYPKAKIGIIGSQPGEKMNELINGTLSNSPQFQVDYETLIKNL